MLRFPNLSMISHGIPRAGRTSPCARGIPLTITRGLGNPRVSSFGILYGRAGTDLALNKAKSSTVTLS